MMELKNNQSHVFLVLITVLAILHSGCSSNSGVIGRVSQPQLAKDYVLFSALKKAYSNDIGIDPDISPSIYQEVSDYTIFRRTSSVLDSLAAITVRNIEPSQIVDYSKQKAIFINCLAFYKSDQLDDAVEQLVEKSARGKKKYIIQAYKDYMFFTCLKKAYDQNQMNDDVSQAVYADLSGYALAGPLGKSLDSLASDLVINIKPTQIADYSGKKAQFAECLGFYKSSKLEKSIRKILQE